MRQTEISIILCIENFPSMQEIMLSFFQKTGYISSLYDIAIR